MSSPQQLPEWKCHKVVRAAQIVKTNLLPNGNYHVHCNTGEGFADFEIPASVFARGFPMNGDFLVHYEHGYWSWSPQAVFREGYTRMEHPQ